MPQNTFSAQESNTTTSTIPNQENMRNAKNPIDHVSSSHNTDDLKDLDQFVRLGRSGRRNAIADVNLDPNINVSTTSLSELMCKIDCGSKEDQAVKN